MPTTRQQTDATRVLLRPRMPNTRFAKFLSELGCSRSTPAAPHITTSLSQEVTLWSCVLSQCCRRMPNTVLLVAVFVVLVVSDVLVVLSLSLSFLFFVFCLFVCFVCFGCFEFESEFFCFLFVCFFCVFSCFLFLLLFLFLLVLILVLLVLLVSVMLVMSSCYFVSLLARQSGQCGQVVSLVSLVSLLLLVVSVCDVLLLLLFCLPLPQKGRTRLTQHVRFAWVLSIALTLGSLLHAAAWDAIRFMLASQIESLAHFRGCQLFCGRSEGNSAPAPARAPLSAPCTCVWRGGREAGEEEEGLNSSRQPMCQAISWHISETSWKDKTTTQGTSRTEGFAQTLSHGSSRFEVDDRRTWGVPSSPQMGVPHREK